MLALTPTPLQTAGERALFAELARWDTGGAVRGAVVASLPVLDGPVGRRISDAVLFVPEGLAVVRIAEVARQRGVVTAHEIMGMVRTIIGFGAIYFEDAECQRCAAILQQARYALIAPSHPSTAEVMGGYVYLLAPLGIGAAVILIGYRVFSRAAPRIAEQL